MPFLGGMPFGGEPDAPQGFRPVSMTQAMMEYAAPIMAYVEDGTVADPNDALQVGLLLWNSTLPEVPVAMRQSRRAIVAQIETTLQMDREEAEAFYDEMIERKAYLFPDEMQPEGSMTMFMRKEVEYLITPFAESQLPLSDAIIPPDGDDDTFLMPWSSSMRVLTSVKTIATGKRTFSRCRNAAVHAIVTGCEPRGYQRR